jgi:hypothetical protein
MDKGIRPACNAKFLELLPTRVNTVAGNCAFRKTVIGFVMEEYGTSLASAATHYNFAFIAAREQALTNETLATQLLGLGRAEDKKGGRKPKAPAATAAPETPAATAAPETPTAPVVGGIVTLGNTLVLQNMMAAFHKPEQAAVEDAVIVSETALEPAGPLLLEAPAVVLHTVRKVKDKSVVAENLTLADAEALIAAAVAGKKAKLELAE